MNRAQERQSAAARKMIVRDGGAVLKADQAKGRYLFAVHHVHPLARLGDAAAASTILTGYMRWARRRLSKASKRCRFVGVLEPSLNVFARREWIQVGLHGVAAVEATSAVDAAKLLRRLLQTDPDPGGEVLRPLQVRPICDDRGGVDGALGYAAKSFEPGGIVRRVSYVDRNSRRNTRSLPLSLREERTVRQLFRGVKPQDQVVLVGAKRRHGRLHPLN